MNRQEKLFEELISLIEDVHYTIELDVDYEDLTLSQYKYIIERLKDVKDEVYLSLKGRREDNNDI